MNDRRIYINSAAEGRSFDGWQEVQGGGITDCSPSGDLVRQPPLPLR